MEEKMELDEYLWRYKRTIREFSRAMDCNENTVLHIKHKTHSPRLLLALKVQHETEGKVTIKEMLTKEDLEKLEKCLGK